MERNRVDHVRRIEGQRMDQDRGEEDHGDRDDCHPEAWMGGHSTIGHAVGMPVEEAEADRDGHAGQCDQEDSP